VTVEVRPGDQTQALTVGILGILIDERRTKRREDLEQTMHRRVNC
jgi:hypothetical protein